MSNSGTLFRLYRVDGPTWEDGAQVADVISATIDRDIDAELVMSGSMEVNGRFETGYHRLVMESVDDSGAERTEMATVYVTTTGVRHSGRESVSACECYSVLLPASKRSLPLGSFFPKGGDLVAGALMMVADVDGMAAPVDVVEPNVRASGNFYAEDGESVLSMARRMLSAAGWHVTVDAHGRVSAAPDSSAIVATLDSKYNDIITGEVSEESDLFDVPNVVAATDGRGNYIEARNTDEDSRTSIGAIGFEVCRFERIDVAEGETLLGRAYALLDEVSVVSDTLSYTRDFDPAVTEGDTIEVQLPEYGISGRYTVKTQTITAGIGATVDETCAAATDTYAR